MRELSVAEQRYRAVLAVVSDGETVSSVAARFGVHRKTVHGWLARYEAEGLEGLTDRSHRPRSCPHQTGADVEAVIATMRSSHPGWGPRRLVHELARAGVDPLPSESAVYRALVRLNLIDPSGRRRRDRKWKRWERGLPMELWQMDVVGGFVLADGRRAKALTGLDDHSRFCVSAHLMLRESSPNVCDGLAAALRAHGVPGQILTDNGKVFTGRFNQPPVEVLFDRICRENGIEHLHTQPRSPTTTGKVERFHRALRTEFRTDRIFTDLATAQAELDQWVHDYNHDRPHQALDMATPASRFLRPDTAPVTPIRPTTRVGRPAEDRHDGTWVTRRASAVGVVCVSWQQVCLGVAAAGRPIDVWVTDNVLQFYDGDQLLRTHKRESTGEVRVKRSTAPQRRSTVTPSVTDQPN
ncbi:IS481 family transposase [Nocardioides glacieisoli]|uniref:IS481 family transposase n=1 Tax=Nocardioides glacieisoli TaxID=1168730 RepID=A0A4V1RKH3_9ACTN|nr:IS481 family transposase [Nocardioides glacieisoli]RYB92282.1 IS481 family transposase [Nocardioides glacieisoli]